MKCPDCHFRGERVSEPQGCTRCGGHGTVPDPVNLSVVNVETSYTRFRKVRVYFCPVGESVMEHFQTGRHNRPIQALRKLLPEALDKVGITFTRARWSQKAGCSCPCSPGFILDAEGWEDVHVSYGVAVGV